MTETCLFFGNHFLLGVSVLIVVPVLLHDVAAVADHADAAVVIAQLDVAFLTNGYDDRFCPC